MKKSLIYIWIFTLMLNMITWTNLKATSTLPTTLYVGNIQVVNNGTLTNTTSGDGWYFSNGVLYFTSTKFFSDSSYYYDERLTAEIYAEGDLIVDLNDVSQSIIYQEYSVDTKCIFYVSNTLKIIGDGHLYTRITNGGDGRAFGARCKTLDLSDLTGSYVTAGCYSALESDQLILPDNDYAEIIGDYTSNRGVNSTLITDLYDPFALRYLYFGDVAHISFDGNGASGSMDPIHLEANASLYPMPSPTFTPNNDAQFLGWTTNKDSSEVEYTLNDAIHFINNDFTLYAIWDKQQVPNKTYTIAFDANGANGNMDAAIVNENDSYTIADCQFTHPDGNVFVGWALSSDGEVVYQANDVISNITSNLRLYPIFKSDVEKITFNHYPSVLKTNQSFKLSLIVDGVGNYSQGVTYTISNQTSENTTIDQEGNLYIGDDEEAQTITITATSIQNPSITASITISIEEAYAITIDDTETIHKFKTFDQAINYLNDPNNSSKVFMVTFLSDCNQDFIIDNNILLSLNSNNYQLIGSLNIKALTLLIEKADVSGEVTLESAELTFLSSSSIKAKSLNIYNSTLYTQRGSEFIVDHFAFYDSKLKLAKTKPFSTPIVLNNSKIQVITDLEDQSYAVILSEPSDEAFAYSNSFNFDMKDTFFTSYDENYRIEQKDKELYLVPNVYTIEVLSDEHGQLNASKLEAKANEIITLTYQANDHYRFDHYEIIEGDITIENNQFMMPTSKVIIKAHFTLDFSFIDVSSNEWYYEVVKNIYALDLMSATGKGSQYFEPDASLTRGMVATILYRMADYPQTTYTPDFSDVAANLWYSDAICWASQNNIVSGYNDGRYGPDDPITRQDLCVMLRNYANYCGLKTNINADHSGQFADFYDIDGYALKAISFCYESNIISGANMNGINYMKPKDYCTRAQAAKMMYYIYQITK